MVSKIYIVFYIPKIMQYLLFKKGEQTNFLREVKSKLNITWLTLSNFLGIDRSMIYHYLSEHSKIPLDSYKSLCKLAKVDTKSMELIEIKNKVKPVFLPRSLTNSLAELIGIIAGDGHISGVNYEISVSGHKELDYNFLTKHVGNLIYNLFKLPIKIKESKTSNGMRVTINSKLIVEYFSKKFDLPIGKKKGNLHIPKQIKEENKFIIPYIRGLFDTDGSIYLRRKKNLVVCITSRDYAYLSEVKKAFLDAGFNPSVSGKDLYLYGNSQVNKFFNKVKPKNKKHLSRYNSYKELQLNL